MIIDPEVVLQSADQEKMTKMVIGGSQLITESGEVTMLPLERAAVAYKNTFLPWTNYSIVFVL